MRFSQKWAVVSGGTGAVGRGIVTRFVREGARVVIPVREEHLGSHAGVFPEELSPQIELSPCDVTNESSVEQFGKWLSSRQIQVDFLVHAAGAYAGGVRVEETTMDQWEVMLRANLVSTFLMARLVLPAMRLRNEGRLIFIAAATALRPPPLRGAYAISKRGVVTLMECLTEEVQGTGITVNVIAPGTVLTDANRESMPEADTRRWVKTEDIASAVTYLCSPEGQSVRGSVLTMSGGV